MALSDIEHVVVLMLENRSFDCLLGKLYPPSDEFDGLPDGSSNNDLAGNPVQVWNSGSTTKASMSIPDPGELFIELRSPHDERE